MPKLAPLSASSSMMLVAPSSSTRGCSAHPGRAPLCSRETDPCLLRALGLKLARSDDFAATWSITKRAQVHAGTPVVSLTALGPRLTVSPRTDSRSDHCFVCLCERARPCWCVFIMGTALHAFEAISATHLALECGQRVRIIEERDDGWSYGEAETGEHGSFPTSYVQPDGLDGAHSEMSLAPKLPRSDSFTTIASRRATLPNIAAAQSIGKGLRGHLAKTLSSTNADELPDVSPWDSVSCFGGGAQEEPELRPLGDSGGSGLGLTSDEVANLLGSIELNNAEQLQHWARTEPITGGDLQQLLFLERAESDAILLNAGLSSALHRRRLLSQVQGWSQCGVPPRLIESSPGLVHAMPLAAPTRQTQGQKPVEAAVPADAVAAAAILATTGEWSIDAVTVSTFSQMFADACASQGPGTDRLGKAEAGPVLAMSGLPTETLLQIWSLADVNGDDRLDLRGFLLCCWLVQRSVQRQLPPPASLPPELLASTTTAVAPSTVPTSTEAQPTEPPSTKPHPMPPATPVGDEEFGLDSGGFDDAGVAKTVAAATVAATAENAAVEARDLQPRLQTEQLAERLVAARAAAAVEAQRALAVVDSVAGALAELEAKRKEERPVNDTISQVGDGGCSHAERMRGLVVSVKEEGPEALFVVEGAPLPAGGDLRELEPQPTLPPRPTRASTASLAALPGASLSRQVASVTTPTPVSVSTHVTQQLLLTVLSESARSLPDKRMRSAACPPYFAEPCTFMSVYQYQSLPCTLTTMPTCMP